MPPPQQTVVCLAFFHPLSCEFCILILKCLIPFTRFGCSHSPMLQALPGPAFPPWGSVCKSSRPFIMKCTKSIWNKIQNIPKSYLPQLNYFKYSECVWSRENYWIFIICCIRNQAATLWEGNCSLLTAYLYSKQIYKKNLIALILYCNFAAVLFYPADIFL